MFDLLPADAAAALDAEIRRGARTGQLELAAAAAIVHGAGTDADALRARYARVRAITPPGWEAAWRAANVELVLQTDAAPRAPGPADAHRLVCARGLASVAAFTVAWICWADAAGTPPTPPHVAVHADLAPQAAAARGRRRATQLLAAVAERGLVGRPWLLWLGPPVPAWTLEPYLVDLAPQLLATRGGAGAPEATRWAEQVGTREHVDGERGGSLDHLATLHHLATAAGARHPPLAEERRRAREAGGIVALHVAGVEATVVDLARLGPGHAHPELGPLPANAPWSCAAQAPILVCVDWAQLHPGDVAHEGAAMLVRLLEGVGPQVRRLDLVLPGPTGRYRGGAHSDGSLRLLRALWVAGRTSALVLPAPSATTLAGASWRLHRAGRVVEAVRGHAEPLDLSLELELETEQANVCVGAHLVEAALACRQRGTLPAVCRPSAVLDAGPADAGVVASWAAELVAAALGTTNPPPLPLPERPNVEPAAPPPATLPPASTRPQRPTPPAHRGPLLRA